MAFEEEVAAWYEDIEAELRELRPPPRSMPATRRTPQETVQAPGTEVVARCLEILADRRRSRRVGSIGCAPPSSASLHPGQEPWDEIWER